MERQDDTTGVTPRVCPDDGKSEATHLYVIPWQHTFSVVYCANCVFIFQPTPLPLTELQKYHPTNNIFHLYVPKISHTRLMQVRRDFWKNIFSLLPQTLKHSTLSIGCELADSLASFKQGRWHRANIELSTGKTAFARKKLWLHLWEAPLKLPAIPPDTIDLLCASGAFGHTHDIRMALASMHTRIPLSKLGNPTALKCDINNYFCVEHTLNFYTTALKSAVRSAGFAGSTTEQSTLSDDKNICCIFRKKASAFYWHGMVSALPLATQLAHDVYNYISNRQRYLNTSRQYLEPATTFAANLKLEVHETEARMRQITKGISRLRNASIFLGSALTKKWQSVGNKITQTVVQRLAQSARFIPLYRDRDLGGTS